MKIWHPWHWLLALVLLVGCGQTAAVSQVDTGQNADTQSLDTAVDIADAGLVDAVPTDATATDSALPDSVLPDGVLADIADTAADTSLPEDASAVDAETGPDVTYPIGTTSVWIHYPGKGPITLRGDKEPLSWQVDSAPVQILPDVSIFTLPEKGGQWQVKPLLAGAWSIGPNYVVTAGQQRHIYAYFDKKLAMPRREDFAVTMDDGSQRMVRVRLPAGYDENTTANYPWILMLDGQNLYLDSESSMGQSWKLGEAIDASMVAGKLTEFIVVGVDHGGDKRIAEYTPWPDPKEGGGLGQAHLTWIETKVVPKIVSKYRVSADLPLIGGSSLGALMSLYAAAAHPQIWRGAVAMSGAWWWDALQITAWLPTSPGVKNPFAVWLDAGDQNDGLADTQGLRDLLLSFGWQLDGNLGYYEAKNANHSEASWSVRVHLPLEFFFNPGDRAPAF